MRNITRETLLYTEMIGSDAVVNNTHRLDDFIGYHKDVEVPLAIQLGGSDSVIVGDAASICENFGKYYEINLNAGCPSNKAKKAGYGAELMLQPDNVRQLVYSMKRKATMSDITVKCRVGVTGRETFENLVEFVAAVKCGGVSKMIIHARICVLRGLTPAQNRTIPPLQYDVVTKLVDTFPDMKFVLNGGISTFEQAESHLYSSDSTNVISNCSASSVNAINGIMIGRAAYNNPWLFADADRRFYNKPNLGYTRREVAERYLEYAQDMQDTNTYGSSTPNLAKPLHNYFNGIGNEYSKLYKRKLDMLIKDSVLNKMSIQDIFWSAVEDTVPVLLLDENPVFYIDR